MAFVQATNELRALLWSVGSRSQLHPDDPDQDHPELALQGAVFNELDEVWTIFQTIEELLAEARIIHTRQMTLWPNLPGGPVDPTTPSGAELAALSQRQMALTGRIRVLIKAVHEWIYHVAESMDALGWRGRLSVDLRARLATHLEFRHKVVAHKRRPRVHFSGGLRWQGNWDAVWLDGPIYATRTARDQAEHLWRLCAGHVPDAESTEDNYYERVRAMATNLGRLPGSLQPEVKSFMERYGAPAVELAALAEFTRDLGKELLPMLRPQQDSA